LSFPLRHALLLGLVHGPTEVLPVSSSAHTALLPRLAGWPSAELAPELAKTLEVALHGGAALALALALRAELAQELRRLDRRRAAVLALSLAPPALVGYALEGPLERHLSGPRTIALGLSAGALAMAVADTRSPASRTVSDAGPRDGLALGLAQALALLPGVSRNGATLTAARALGFTREDSQTLSWRVALPVLLGATALKGRRLAQRDVPAGLLAPLALGAGSAFVSTLVCSPLLAPVRRTRSLLPFSLYRVALAAVVYCHPAFTLRHERLPSRIRRALRGRCGAQRQARGTRPSPSQ
jgi:undecaprenyl-diphosphatase